MKNLPNMFQDFKSMKGDRNPATSKRKTSEVSEPSSDDDLPLSKRNKRLSSINDSNTATSKRKGSEDSISSDNCLRQSKKTRRLSSTSDTNPAASSKRKHREVSEPSSDDDLRQSKRTKRFSSTHAASNNKIKHREASKPSSDDDLRQSKRLEPERASSTGINDIPKELLVEILCRLPCAKSVFRCKSVSKSWRSLTSDPDFIGRFLWLQRQNQTLIPGTIINRWGYELLTKDLFATFRSFETEKIERLEVLATWNDLVLCRSLRRFGHHICEQSCKCDDGQYYICNPRTSKQEMQLVKLPWIHECGLFWDPIVGFICEPYYKEEEEDDTHADSSTDQKEERGKRKVIRINAESKFKVVRIVPPEVVQNDHDFFKIQVFSSEIGAWRESLVECPKEFDYYQLIYDKPEHQPEHPRGAFASNGMLYWIAKEGHLLGLGPLMINNKSTTDCSNSTAAESADGDSGYQFHLIKLQDEDDDEDGDGDVPPSLYHLQSHRGRLQLVRVDRNEDGNGAKLVVWELAKEELEQMAVQRGGELGQRHRKDYSIMDRVQYDKLYTWMQYFGCDPNDSNKCFVSLTEKNRGRALTMKKTGPKYKNSGYECNIHTRVCSKMEMHDFTGITFQIMLPRWPTPLPKIHSLASETSSEQVIQWRRFPNHVLGCNCKLINFLFSRIS